jgi:hypothetical protein
MAGGLPYLLRPITLGSLTWHREGHEVTANWYVMFDSPDQTDPESRKCRLKGRYRPSKISLPVRGLSALGAD